MFICLQDLPQLRSLYLNWTSPEPVVFGDTLMGLTQLRSLHLSWTSPEPVMFGDALMGLTQLETLDFHLSDFSGLQQLPPHNTSLTLHTFKLLDVAMVPCLQSCSGLQRLKLHSAAGVHKHAVALRAQATSITSDCMACRC